MVGPLSSSRLIRTVVQFKQLRLQIAGLLGLALLGVGVGVNPRSAGGVVLVSLGTGVLASTVVASIALEREAFAQAVLGLGVQEVFHDRRQAFDNSFWNSLIRAARSRFVVLGVANHGYLRSPGVKEETRTAILAAVRDRGVQVEILWLNPEHSLATVREEEEGIRGTRDDTVDSIEYFWGIREELDHTQKHLMTLKEHEATPTCGTAWSDDLLVVTHYLAAQLNLASPGFVLGPSMSMQDRLVQLIRSGDPSHPRITEAYMENYRVISDRATEITSDRVVALLARRGTWGPEAEQRRSEADIGDEEAHDQPGAGQQP